MRFPSDYPHQPLVFRFLTPNIIHPNVYSDGNLCISPDPCVSRSCAKVFSRWFYLYVDGNGSEPALAGNQKAKGCWRRWETYIRHNGFLLHCVS
ncbi:hypothetical protein J3F84DRAFT_310840 [Trichoderma pleuroticola]